MLSFLNCPYCGTLLQESQGTRSPHSQYGVLQCACGRYPVVAGIPILKKGAVGAAGQTVREVMALVEHKRYLDALLCMLTPAPPGVPALAPALIKALPAILAFRWLKAQFHQLGLPRWRESVTAFFTGCDSATAREVLDFYLQRSQRKQSIGYEYSAYRFGQPRHLVALSVASVIRRPKRPVLELACGSGHITRSLVSLAGGQPVIGIDSSFFVLYVAKKWIAPAAEYVCYSADARLPFPDGAFSAAVCVDGIHYFDHKVTTIQELNRVTQPDGAILLLGSRNALVHPYGPETVALYGHPLSPDAYRALVADVPHRLIADGETLSRYLQKMGPALAASSDVQRLAEAPLLSIVATQQDDIFRDYGRFDDWPHAEGRLMVNPLYKERGQVLDDTLKLELTWPSRFFKEENSGSPQYLPESVTVDRAVLTDIEAGRRTREVDGLLAKCVVLGVPDRYW